MLKAFSKVVLLAFNATVGSHINIVDSRQRGFRSGATLKQFGAKSHFSFTFPTSFSKYFR